MFLSSVTTEQVDCLLSSGGLIEKNVLFHLFQDYHHAGSEGPVGQVHVLWNDHVRRELLDFLHILQRGRYAIECFNCIRNFPLQVKQDVQVMLDSWGLVLG